MFNIAVHINVPIYKHFRLNYNHIYACIPIYKHFPSNYNQRVKKYIRIQGNRYTISGL